MKKYFVKSTVIIVLVLALITAFTDFIYADGNIYKRGERSADIVVIQEALKELKLFNEVATGYFGAVTEEAVKKFQKQNNLTADGVVGPGTLKALLGKSSISGTNASRSAVERTKVNITHKIKSGDTIWDIADDYNVTRESILKYNNLTENSILQIGHNIIIPNVVREVTKKIPSQTDTPTASANQSISNTTTLTAENKTDGASDLSDNLYIVKEGDTLYTIAEDFGVDVKALAELNGLSLDSVLQADQELNIPEAAEHSADTNTESNNEASQLKGEYLSWYDEVQYIFDKNDVAVVTDLKTGKAFKVKRLYGRNHADVEPLTKEDTAVMKSIYGSWSWDRRAIIVTIDGKNIAASMNGMPHGGQQIDNNSFQGHFCIHFKGSKTHKGNRVDATHQAAVKMAAGIK